MISKDLRFELQVAKLRDAFDSLSNHRVILFGGKGGVGKTTVASLAALHLSQTRPVTLFSTDPASNLADLWGDRAPGKLRIEALDAQDLYDKFLDANLEAFLELGDRGTYLDREELQRFFELSVPGIDELMAWMRVGELAQQTERLLIVDTAPTGHTLRMLSSSEHFRQFEKALEAMQAKHADIVLQLARSRRPDSMDEFLERFGKQLDDYRALLTDAKRTAFMPVFLAEPWVVEQTRRLIEELRSLQISIPFAVLNQAPHQRVIPSPSTSLGAGSARDLGGGKTKATAQVPRSTLGITPVVAAPRACVQLDGIPRLKRYLTGNDDRHKAAKTRTPDSGALDLGAARLVFFAGKGGVGKTTSASSTALQLASASPGARFTLISVDPAHSVRDVFAGQSPPANLSVEIVDTKAEWDRLGESIGDEIERAIGALTPQGVSLVHDTDVMKRLVEIAPPGADELFAIMRLSDLMQDDAQQRIIVDTAPTGHFLRLLELPQTAGEWVREFMRLLLKYKELIPPGSLGEQLVRASRALKSFEELLQSDHCAAVVVTRPERIVAEETRRLVATLEQRGIRNAGTIANYLTPESECSCDQSRRAGELEILASLKDPLILIERQEQPPIQLDDLRRLVPLRQDE